MLQLACGWPKTPLPAVPSALHATPVAESALRLGARLPLSCPPAALSPLQEQCQHAPSCPPTALSPLQEQCQHAGCRGNVQQHQRCAVAAGLAAPSQMEREPSEAIDAAGGLGSRRSSRSARAQRPGRDNGRTSKQRNLSQCMYFCTVFGFLAIPLFVRIFAIWSCGCECRY